MGQLSNRLGIRALSLEDPSQPLVPYSALMEPLGIGRSDAGVFVNEKQAMRLTTAFACIMVISSDLSSLPLSIYQQLPDSSVREAFHHKYYELLHDTPNSMMGSTVWRGAWLAQALGWGNGYTYILRDKGARAISLQLLPSDRTSPVLREGQLYYATTATHDGSVSYIDPANVLHLSGLSTDGIVGLSPIQTCKNAFGLAIAAEKFGAQFFGNGARSTGVLTHPGHLGTEAYENLKKSLNERMTGQNALKPLLLEEGLQWNQTSIAPNDAQFLQTRQFQRSEIAALYRVAMHLLQDLARATNNNIEHQSLDHIRYCLRPWAVKMEQEINRKLLGGRFYCEHNFNDFQRGDFASQTQGYTLLRNAGVYSANDILRALRQNPIPGEDGGDVRLAPLNMVPLSSLVRDPADQNAPATDANDGETITDLRRERILGAYRRLVRDAVGRIRNRKECDEETAYKAFQPIMASMAEALLAMHCATGKISEHEQAAASHARKIAASRKKWPASSTDAASELTSAAYDALAEVLLGEKR